MADPETSTSVIGALGAIILALLGKLGWDQRNKNKVLSITDDDITPDSKPGRRDSILMILTDRVHAVRNELAPQIGKLQLEDAKMDLRITQNRDDINKLRVDLETGFKTTNAHIDDVGDRIERQIKESVDRIWRRIDKET